MTRDPIDYAIEHLLVESNDPEIDKPVYRKPGFAGVKTFGDMDLSLAKSLREARERAGLKQAEFAPLMGLSTAVYGRYERAFSKMHVTRMIHACEVLGFMPLEMLFDAAPYLWGDNEEEAKDRVELAKLVIGLPHGTTRDLLALVKKMADLQNQVDSKPANKETIED